MSEFVIRAARAADVETLRRLYNHYIETSPSTFDVEPKSLAERREWMSHYAESGRHRLLVGERDGAVVGFASSSPLRPKAAYETSVEVSVYVEAGCTGAGLGRALYEALFAALAGEDVHRAYAGVTVPNPASEALHHRFGFASIGVYDEVGRKFGQYWSVRWLEKRLR